MAVAQVLGVPYTTDIADPLFQFDCYTLRGDARNPSAGLLVFVHGGAWRSEDKADHAGLAKRLAQATGWPVLVPNYRLTSKTRSEHMFRHPGHAEDILDFLGFLETWNPPDELLSAVSQHPDSEQTAHQPFNTSKLVLIGHSCSAHMLASIFLDSDSATPSLSPPPQLREAAKGIAMSEGIYDIDLLLKTFPPYRDWFIEDAFGPRENYAPFDVTRYPSRQPTTKHYAISWLLLHSKGDTLIDVAQSQKMYDHLVKLHEDTEGRIYHDFGTLQEGHDEILHGDEYVRLIKDFVDRFNGSTPHVP